MENWGKIRWTADELLATEFPEVRFLDSKRFLPEVGLVSLNGLPKSGKSWLALDLSLEVAEKEEVNYAKYF